MSFTAVESDLGWSACWLIMTASTAALSQSNVTPGLKHFFRCCACMNYSFFIHTIPQLAHDLITAVDPRTYAPITKEVTFWLNFTERTSIIVTSLFALGAIYEAWQAYQHRNDILRIFQPRNYRVVANPQAQ